MPYFRYKATDENNQTSEGMIQAATADLAADILADRNLTIISLAEEKVALGERSVNFLNRVKLKDLVIFARQLSVVISANIPLVQGLKILVNQTSGSTLKTIISDLADDVEGGATLSSALARHPRVFDDFFINIIRAGETSGKLDEVLLYLAEQREKDYDLMSKIRGAMIYPIFIVGGLGVVGVIMMIFVLPKLTETLAQSGTELPLTTKILIFTSDFMINYWWLLLIAAAGLIGGFQLLVRTPSGRYGWDKLKLKFPIFGSMIQEIIIVRFARSLNTLTNGGVPLTKSLEIVSTVVGNAVYRDLVKETAREVEDGNPIATVFLQSPDVPAMVSQMMNLGERTGKLEDILDKLANFYGREVSNKVANMVALIEPLIMIILGVAVGIMVSAILLPMYSLALNM